MAIDQFSRKVVACCPLEGPNAGKHASIAVTERVILTLKHEWLQRVPVIRGLYHLSQLLHTFEVYYNEYRGHATRGGAIPTTARLSRHSYALLVHHSLSDLRGRTALAF